MSLLLDNREVTARAAHECELCGAEILPAEKYQRQKVAGDGTVWTFKACLPCYDLSDIVVAWSLDNEGIGQQTYLEWAHDVRSGMEPVEPCVYTDALEFLRRFDEATERRRRVVEPQPTITRNAKLSADGLYRYSLHREWRDLSDPSAMPRWLQFVMLNPSTADGTTDDATIRRCIGFARSWGATGIAVVNLYAFRATSPADLWKAEDPVGPENDETLARFFAMAARYGHPIVAAWGAHARPDRVAEVLQIPGANRLQALGVTKAGAPRHPLYMPRDVRPAPWPAKAVTR